MKLKIENFSKLIEFHKLENEKIKQENNKLKELLNDKVNDNQITENSNHLEYIKVIEKHLNKIKILNKEIEDLRKTNKIFDVI